MNESGFTHVSLGNHEFDLSVQVLLDRLKEVQFTVLNSNIRGIEGENACRFKMTRRSCSISRCIQSPTVWW